MFTAGKKISEHQRETFEELIMDGAPWKTTTLNYFSDSFHPYKMTILCFLHFGSNFAHHLKLLIPRNCDIAPLILVKLKN